MVGDGQGEARAQETGDGGGVGGWRTGLQAWDWAAGLRLLSVCWCIDPSSVMNAYRANFVIYLNQL